MMSLKDLEKVIIRFKMDEFYDIILPYLPFISWSMIKKFFVQNKINFTIKNIAQFVRKCGKLENMDQETLLDLFTMLKLLDLSHHSLQKRWHVYELIGQDIDHPMDDHDLQKSLMREFRLSGLHAHIKVISSKNLQWVSIIIKKLLRNKGIKFSKPFMFAYGANCLFLHTHRIRKEVMKVVISALHYKRIKNCKLRGKDIPSLLKCLKKKSEGRLINETDYKANAVMIKMKDSNYQLSHIESRRCYVKNVFGQDLPVLQELSILTKDCPWFGNEEGADKTWKVHTELTFKSPDVYKMLMKMVEEGHIELPLPEYLAKLPYIGKNEITLQNVS